MDGSHYKERGCTNEHYKQTGKFLKTVQTGLDKNKCHYLHEDPKFHKIKTMKSGGESVSHVSLKITRLIRLMFIKRINKSSNLACNVMTQSQTGKSFLGHQFQKILQYVSSVCPLQDMMAVFTHPSSC